MSTADPSPPPTVAVIGSGVAGLTAAYLLSRTHNVTLYEADQRLGGHAHSHDVTDPDGTSQVVDTGFIVHNRVTYPNLTRLFRELGVTTRPTEMSMSIQDERSGLVYAGGRGVGGILAQPWQVLDPRFVSVLVQVKRFHRRAHAFLERTPETDLSTFGEFLRREGFSAGFLDLYAVPLVSCVWSTGSHTALEYPARHLFQFLANHGMLTVTGTPKWYTVAGGSRSYVDAIARGLPRVRAGQAVVTVQREPDGVRVVDASGACERFDRTVLAVHADQALNMLADPSAAEKEVLGSFQYAQSRAVLHTDDRLLPSPRRARACWNYRSAAGPDNGGPAVTYWMNRLQGIDSNECYLVTLNDSESIDPGRVRTVVDYQTPIYDGPAVAAQARLPELSTAQTAYAGAYHGWGFHEDGCRSGVEAARAFGVRW